MLLYKNRIKGGIQKMREKLKNIKKGNEGITLIALIVTITSGYDKLQNCWYNWVSFSMTNKKLVKFE